MKKTGIIILIILTLAILFIIIKPILTSKTVETREDIFAECLTNSNLTMYGTDWCSHCLNQKKLFGKIAFKKINYINCDLKSEQCQIEGITGYPTWKINGSSYPGAQSFERLGQLTGCVY